MAEETKTKEEEELVLQFCLNTNRTNTKISKLTIKHDNKLFQKLIQISKQKLCIKKKPTRLFLIETGQELTKDNINLLLTQTRAAFFHGKLSISVSIGEEFVGITDSTSELRIKQAQQCIIRYIAHTSHYTRDAGHQLEGCSKLQGMKMAIGQPDLHPGKGYPIGATLVTTDFIYPYLIGNDIGCGMSLVTIPFNVDSMSDQKVTRLASQLKHLDGPYKNYHADKHGSTAHIDIYLKTLLETPLKNWPVGSPENPPCDLEKTKNVGIDLLNFNDSLGTIGHGNHFAELQCIEKIENEELSAQLGLNKDSCYLMIHSGSRGLGDYVLDRHISEFNTKGLSVNSQAFDTYMTLHDNSLQWARRNRFLIAQRFLEDLNIDLSDIQKCQCIIDIFHNYVCKKSSNEFASEKENTIKPSSGNPITSSKNSKKQDHPTFTPDDDTDSDSDTNSNSTKKKGKRVKFIDDIEPNVTTNPSKEISSATKSSITDIKETNTNTNEKDTKKNITTGDTNTNTNTNTNTDIKPEEKKELESNNLENKTDQEQWWIHRKGAAPSDEGFIVIPGSRGSFSYIVKPKPKSYSGFSVAHGAGRQWMRSKAQKKMSRWYPNPNSLSRTDKFRSVVICENKELMYEEAPQAYKNVDDVIEDLKYFDLIDVVAILKPLITYKTRTPMGK